MASAIEGRHAAGTELRAGTATGPGLRDLERTPGERRQIHVGLHLKLALVVSIALAWAGLSLWIAIPWIESLGASITMPLAIAVIFMSPISVAGYAQEMVRARRSW